jgi:hypothetical protein
MGDSVSLNVMICPLLADRPEGYDVIWKEIPMKILWAQAFNQPFVLKGV